MSTSALLLLFLHHSQLALASLPVPLLGSAASMHSGWIQEELSCSGRARYRYGFAPSRQKQHTRLGWSGSEHGPHSHALEATVDVDQC